MPGIKLATAYDISHRLCPWQFWSFWSNTWP